jgi:hypothetical protein
MICPSVKGRNPADTRMDADLTSFMKDRRLALACRQITMRVGCTNVDEKR